MTAIGGVLALLGAVLTLLAAVGLLRLPDPVTRLHAATKASTGGLVLLLAAAAVLRPSADAAVKLLMAVAFQLVTAPIAAHVIGRASYRAGLVTDLDGDELADDAAGDR